MHQELKRNGVTLQLLWEEYSTAHGEHAYRYSQFCAHYHEYRKTLARSMRQIHRASEKVFIDYSGDTVAVIDPNSGEILTAEIFVATLGASKYAYAEATWTQTMPDWIGSTIRMLEFFWGNSESVDSRQFESGDQESLPLRTGGDFDLRGLRTALRRGNFTGAAVSRKR